MGKKKTNHQGKKKVGRRHKQALFTHGQYSCEKIFSFIIRQGNSI